MNIGQEECFVIFTACVQDFFTCAKDLVKLNVIGLNPCGTFKKSDRSSIHSVSKAQVFMSKNF